MGEGYIRMMARHDALRRCAGPGELKSSCRMDSVSC